MMQKITTTVLATEFCGDVLRFSFPDGSHFDVELTGDDGNVQLKNVFVKILGLQMKDDVEVSFERTEGYGNGMYEQACMAYTQMLGKELAPVRTLILNEDRGSKPREEP